jgi:hypothetical protein
MRYLFLHPVFPGQFTRVMEALARDPANEVVHCSRESAVRMVGGVRKVRYQVPAATSPKPHAFLQRSDEALQQGLAVLQVVQQLQQQGFVPDLIYGYAGWGPTLFMKDVFPKTPLLGYFEWFLNPFGAEYNFDPAHPLAFEAQLALRLCNANMLLDLHACDHGVTPSSACCTTAWTPRSTSQSPRPRRARRWRSRCRRWTCPARTRSSPTPPAAWSRSAGFRSSCARWRRCRSAARVVTR